MESFREYLVTGTPGAGFPPYRQIWSKFEGPNPDAPETGARDFVARQRANGKRWEEGPDLWGRTVTHGQWEKLDGLPRGGEFVFEVGEKVWWAGRQRKVLARSDDRVLGRIYRIRTRVMGGTVAVQEHELSREKMT